MNGTQPKTFSKSVNALRFLAAIIVVLAHGGYSVLKDLRVPQAFLHAIQARSLATSLFFLISGFVITQSLCRHEVPRRDFLLRRLARLYPINLACFLVLFAKDWLTNTLPDGHALVFQGVCWATMTHGFFPQNLAAYNYAAWAVTAFMAGYLVVPGFARSARATPGNALPVAALSWMAVLIPNLVLVCALGRQFVYTLDPAVAVSPGVGNGIAAAHFCVALRVLEMLMGSMAAVFVWEHWQSPGVRFVSKSAVLLGIAAAIGVGVEYGSRDDRVLYLLTHGLLLPVLAAALVGLWQNDGLVEKVLGWRFLQKGGKAAILIYFLHVPVLELYRLLAASVWGANAAAHGSALFLASFATTTIVAFSLQTRYDAFSARLSEWLRRVLPERVGASVAHAGAQTAA